MRITCTRSRAAVLVFALAFAVVVACDGPQLVSPSEDVDPSERPEPTSTKPPIPNSTAVPEPTPTKLPIDGETWILETVDARPLIDGTYATLTINGPQLAGFDGCNSFGGHHETGDPVVNRNGEISVPPVARTAAGCPTPEIRDQANRYLGAIKDQASHHRLYC